MCKQHKKRPQKYLIFAVIGTGGGKKKNKAILQVAFKCPDQTILIYIGFNDLKNLPM